MDAFANRAGILQAVELEQLKQVEMAVDKHKERIFSKYRKYRGGLRSWAPGPL